MAVLHGDCVEVMRSMPEDSVDAVVTDPPYDLVGNSRNGSSQPGDLTTPYGRSGPSKKRAGFMGKEWDGTGVAFKPETWAEALRVLKPGGYLLAFGGTRTVHRLTCAIEDAGFEIRDSITWIYGSGFPKSHDVSKAIDKMAGAEREVNGCYTRPDGSKGREADQGYGNANVFGDGTLQGEPATTAPATEAAKQWEGFGTALKPAHEPVVVARKPLSESSVARNVLRWGTGSLNIDASRIGYSDNDDPRIGKDYQHHAKAGLENGSAKDNASGEVQSLHKPTGRWPSNLLISHSPECQRVGVKRVRGSLPASGPALTGESVSVARGKFNGVESTPNYTDPDGFEEVEAWECVTDETVRRAADHAPLLTSVLGFPVGCPSCLRFCDERVRGVLGDDQALLPSRHDALDALRLELLVYVDTPLHQASGSQCNCGGSCPPCSDKSTPENKTVQEHHHEALPEQEHRTVGMNSLELPHSGRHGSTGGSKTDGSCNGKTPLHSSCISAVVRLLDSACACLATGVSFTPIIPSLCPVAELDRQSGTRKSGSRVAGVRSGMGFHGANGDGGPAIEGSEGGASRFFLNLDGEPGFAYVAKASRSERNAFTKSLPRTRNKRKRYQQDRSGRWLARVINKHPTVKPLKLLSYLVKLVTPPGGVVLDPFAGSGSTLVAAIQEGFEAVGIEQDASYLEIAERRVAHARAEIESQPLVLEV